MAESRCHWVDDADGDGRYLIPGCYGGLSGDCTCENGYLHQREQLDETIRNLRREIARLHRRVAELEAR